MTTSTDHIHPPGHFCGSNCPRYERRDTVTEGSMDQFETGATRSADDDKLDFEGFLSPLVLERYAQYLHEHRVQADGKLRDSDNWQLGMPQSRYVKSAWRHFFDWWKLWRQRLVSDVILFPWERKRIEDDACAVLFNVMGWLHEELKARS